MNPLSKYIILTTDGRAELPVIFSNEIQHSTMVPSGARPVAAGFCYQSKGRILIPEIGSDSLNLGPRAQDKAVLSEFLNLPDPVNSVSPCSNS